MGNLHPDTTDSSNDFPIIREIGFRAPFSWLTKAAHDMAERAQESLFFGFCFAAMGLAVTLVFEHAYQYSSAMTSGFLLLGPFLAIGLYEISRQRETGTRRGFAETLTVWRRNASNIGIFAVVLMVIFLVWARASLVVFALFYTEEMPSLSGFLQQVVRLENIEFMLVYSAVGGLFAIIVFAASLVSIPMMLDRNQDAVTAMLTSVLALARNPGPCLLWGLLIAVLTTLGFALFHAGLVFFMPLVGHASWHAYRALVEPAAAPRA